MRPLSITAVPRLALLITASLLASSQAAASPATPGDPPMTQHAVRRRSLDQAELDLLLHGRAMTLADALSISLLASRQLGVAVANLQRAEGSVSEVKSSLLPQISIGAQAMEFDKSNVIDFGALMGGPSLPLTIANQWNPSLTAGLSVQIDLSGAVRSAASQAEFVALAARIDIDRVRNQLSLDVRSGFYQTLRAHAQVGVAEEDVQVARQRLHDAQANESVGNSPKFDVVSAQRDVAQAEEGLVSAKAMESTALAALKNLVGIDQSARVTLDPGDAFQPIESAPAATSILMGHSKDVTDEVSYGPKYEAMVSDALRLRPEILESAAATEASKHGFQYARRSMLPAVTAGIGYTYQPNNGFFTQQSSAVATLGITVPLFDGGTARARVQEATADLANAESNYRAAVDGVKLEVQNAYVGLIQARARVGLAAAGLAQATEAFRLAKERYQVGVSQSSVVSPQLEVSSAQAALTAASTNKVNAQIDYLLAQAALEHAIGRFAPLGRKQPAK